MKQPKFLTTKALIRPFGGRVCRWHTVATGRTGPGPEGPSPKRGRKKIFPLNIKTSPSQQPGSWNLEPSKKKPANDKPCVKRDECPCEKRDEGPYTLRALGGRQPSWGMGVTSLMDVTTNPAPWRARMAVSRPDPGPFTKTETVLTPNPMAFLAAPSAVTCAAKGVPFLVPLKPELPAVAQTMMLPRSSVILTMVLLKDD
jgi:hypothetical protein